MIFSKIFYTQKIFKGGGGGGGGGGLTQMWEGIAVRERENIPLEGRCSGILFNSTIKQS